MATITSSTGSTIPGQRFFSVAVDTVVTQSPTEYAWTVTQSASLDNVTAKITLVGSFTYPGGVPSGDVSQIRIDYENDGITDLTIAYSSLQPILADLISGNPDLFWETALAQANTFNLAGNNAQGTHSNYSFGLDGDDQVNSTAATGDTATITGDGAYVGDFRTASDGFIGGADTITFNAADPNANNQIVGDAQSGGDSGGTYTGAADIITDISAAGTSVFTATGDFGNARDGSTLNCGNDTITAGDRNAYIAGDVDSMLYDNVTVNAGDDMLNGGTGHDTIVGDISYVFSSATGTVLNAGDDAINGGGGDDTIYGEYNPLFAGAITLNGGNDTIDGGEGDDEIHGQSGNDTLNGGDDDDRLFGGTGDDTIDGDAGIDTADFSESQFAVTVVLGTGVDGSATGNGTDILREIENVVGTDLDDTITGNDDDNVIEGGFGNDTLDGGAGTNTVSYENAGAGVTVDLSLTTQQATFGAGDDTLSNFQNIIGSAFDDFLFGDGANNVIDGGDGNDTILTSSSTTTFPPSGSDTLNGGTGDDIIGFALTGVGQSNVGSNHTFDGGADTDTFVFETFTQDYKADLAAEEFVRISNGVKIATLLRFENVSAGAGDDVLIGNNGNNVLDGNAGDDTLNGNAGNDTLNGGDGSDTLNGGAGFDTLRGGGDADELHGGNQADTLYGDDGDDTLNGDGGADNLFGGAQNDTLNGGDGNDILSGQAGFDTLHGDGGNDTLSGGDQADTLYGDDGDDTLNGDGGADNLFGGAQNDTLNGGDGNDILNGQAGFDTLHGDGGNDTLNGGDQADTLYGDDGDDTLNGDAGADTLYGGNQNDTLNGGAGNDTLNGQAGFDILVGGTGNDTLTGGAQADTFVFEDGFGADTITDFAATNNAEKIDLSAVTSIVDWLDLSTPANGHMYQSGANVIIDDLAGNTIALTGINIGDLDAADFIF